MALIDGLMASPSTLHQIKYRQVYEQEMRGKASAEAGIAEVIHARENAENFSQVNYS